jgi:uncharacterized protein (TIGR00251 family)
MKLTQTKEGTLMEVFVKPNSPKFVITVEGEEEEVVVRCTEEPERGKVNKKLLKAFSKMFHAEVELASGATSRQKKLLIKNAKSDDVERILREQST